MRRPRLDSHRMIEPRLDARGLRGLCGGAALGLFRWLCAAAGGSVRATALAAGACSRGRASRRRNTFAVAAQRPDEIVGASGRGRHRLALDQHAVGGGVAMHRLIAGAAQQFLGISRRHGQRHHRSGHRPHGRFCVARHGPDRPGRQRHRPAIAHIAAHFAFDIVRELARAVFGEIDAVARTQPPHLAFIVRAEIRVLAGLVHESVPHVDIDHAGALGARAIEIVEIDRVGGGFGAADRGQADPEHRHALALEGRNRIVDAFRVNLRPFIAAKFDSAVHTLAALRLGRDARRLILLAGLILFLRTLVGVFFVLLFLGVLVGLFGQIALADVLAVADAEHHDHVVGLLLREDIARDVPPVEIAFRLVAQQAGIYLVLTDDGDFRRVRKRVFQSIGEPVGHAVAHHHDRRRGRGCIRIRLARARRCEEFGLVSNCGCCGGLSPG